MSILQEFEEINNKLVEEYGPNIIKKQDEYCKMIINDYDQDTVANEYVLNADKERYYNNDSISKPLNEGHVYTGLTYNADLWKKFIFWYDKNRIHRYSDDIPYSKRRYWYFTTHGIGPGTIPKDLRVLETRENLKSKRGTMGDYICLDGVLSTDELRNYDLNEEIPED